jgi:hypothetical protein
MSRGPGDAQVKIMETLATHHRLGRDLGWEWRVGGSFYRKRLLLPDEYEHDRHSIAAYERGQRVEVWKLRRDTGLSAPELSRALRSLSRRNFVTLYDARLWYGYSSNMNAKFVCLTRIGEEWMATRVVAPPSTVPVKCQESHIHEVGT